MQCFLKASPCPETSLHKTASVSIAAKSPDIFMDLFCHCCGKHSGVRSRISHQLFFVQLLDNLQVSSGLILNQLGALILKLRQVIKKRRIFRFPFSSPCKLQTLPAGAVSSQIYGSAPLRLLSSLNPFSLYKFRRLEIAGSLHRPPFSLESSFAWHAYEATHPVKGRLHKARGSPVPCALPCPAHRS